MTEKTGKSWLFVLKVEFLGKNVKVTCSPLEGAGKEIYVTFGYPEQAKARRQYSRLSADKTRCLTAFYKALKGERVSL